MANSWTALQIQHRKVRMVLEKFTPPEPDDEYESERRHTIDALKKNETYISAKIEQHDIDERREANA